MKAARLTICLLLLGGCGSRDAAEPSDATAGAPEPKPIESEERPPPAPNWSEAANARYSGPKGVDIRLRDGQWEGEPYVEGAASAPRAGLAHDFLVRGDLDSDGADESVVLLWTSSGGSGTFDYLAVLERSADGSVRERAAAPLGDRVQVRAAAVDDGRLLVDVVQSGPEDALCCPGQKLRRTFALEGNAVKETTTKDQGRLSLSDLDGDWTLLELGRGAVVPDAVEITARFEGGTVAGKASCNRYSGQVEEGDMPGDLALAGPLAVTRRICTPELMEWERRYLQALESLRGFSFTAGRLVLTWDRAEGVDTLVFAAEK